MEAKRNSPIVKEPVESERLPKHAPKVRSLKNIPELNRHSYEYQEEESSCVIENYVEQDSFMPLKDIGNTVVNRDRKKSRDLQTTSRSPLKLTEKTKNQKKNDGAIKNRKAIEVENEEVCKLKAERETLKNIIEEQKKIIKTCLGNLQIFVYFF